MDSCLSHGSLARSETQTATSNIWTNVDDPIFYGYTRYAMHDLLYLLVFSCKLIAS